VVDDNKCFNACKYDKNRRKEENKSLRGIDELVLMMKIK